MPTVEDIRSWPGQTVTGPGDEKLGTVDHVYLDRETGEPTFAAVKTGLFGMKSTLVPVDGLSASGDGVTSTYSKETVKDAPSVDADEELSPEEEQRLYKHYGRDYSAYEGEDRSTEYGGYTTDATARTGTTGDVGGPGHDTSGPNTDEAITRSEEELRVGTTQRETGRARLRKYIVTEDVTTTVPVSREEVRIEREPITDANVGAATTGADLTEEEHEVTLHAEEPVVEKRVVPKERVRLEKDTVTEEVEVNDEVRKERIEADGAEGLERR